MSKHPSYRMAALAAKRCMATIGVLACATSAHALDGDEHSLRQAIGQAGQAIQGELLKGAAATKAVMEGLATYRAQSRLQDKAVALQQDMKQSDQLCQAMGAQEVLSDGAARTRARVVGDQRRSLYNVTRNLNTAATVDSMHKLSNESFCTAEEARIGVCKPTSSAEYANLAGADQNAMYLFQSKSGGDTYEGTRESGQAAAVDAYIARVVSGGAPPELLRIQGSAYERNAQARAYVELTRRYQAFLSMAAYSLNSIKGSRTPTQ
jgi:hypothetical protein